MSRKKQEEGRKGLGVSVPLSFNLIFLDYKSIHLRKYRLQILDFQWLKFLDRRGSMSKQILIVLGILLIFGCRESPQERQFDFSGDECGCHRCPEDDLGGGNTGSTNKAFFDTSKFDVSNFQD